MVMVRVLLVVTVPVVVVVLVFLEVLLGLVCVRKGDAEF